MYQVHDFLVGGAFGRFERGFAVAQRFGIDHAVGHWGVGDVGVQLARFFGDRGLIDKPAFPDLPLDAVVVKLTAV